MDLKISINALRAFISVADIGSVTNSARIMGVLQPTLSRQISDLEEKLGYLLFVRGKKGAQLTTEGERFYEYASELVSAYDLFTSKACAIRNLITGTLRIGHQRSSQDLVIDLTKQFQKKHPYVSIVNHENANDFLLNKLRNDDLQGVFIYQNEIPENDKNIQHLFLRNLHNMLLVSASSPLANRSSVSLKELADQKFVLPGKITSPSRYWEVIKFCEKAGFSPDAASYPESIFQVVLDVVCHEGVAILPHICGIEEGGLVKYLELLNYPEKYPLAFAWQASNDNPTLAAFVDFLQFTTTDSPQEYTASYRK